MENIFRPNKWFVLFCAALVLVFFSLHYISNMRLTEAAKEVATDIFDWQWDTTNAATKITDASVVKKTETDAIVQVKGQQTIKNGSQAETPSEVSAKLTFYKSQNSWFLGKVELE